MGCRLSSNEEKTSNDANKRITQELRKARNRMQNEVKILLLGAGESGKSTIVKQMRIIHENGFSQQEKIALREQVFSHIKQSMHQLVTHFIELEMEMSDAERKNINDFLNWYPTSSNKGLPVAQAQIIKELWESAAIKYVLKRCFEFNLMDSASYYLDAIDRIAQDDYIPNEADVLRVRVKTSGIVETRFWYNSLHVRMVDVGGQRSERKKWIHCFEGVAAIIFCAALSAYASTLLEDGVTNRMVESLHLFESICNSNWFENTSIILFLNKTDLLEPTLALQPLSACFPEYDGDNAFDPASEYIKDEFLSRNRNEEKIIFIHFTCATDTDIIKKVFEDVTNMIINQNLKLLGFL